MAVCKVILFVSRNKDNREIEGFKERRKNFLWNKEGLPIGDFQDFVSKGLVGELSRMYISVNARDMEKTRKMLLVKLINDPVDLTNLDSVVAALAAKSENRAESKWLFDFDSVDIEKQKSFFEDLRANIQEAIKTGQAPEDTTIKAHKTLHGMAYVVSHKFDCQGLLVKWKDLVSLKRDDMLFVTADKKPESMAMKRIPVYSSKDLAALFGNKKE